MRHNKIERYLSILLFSMLMVMHSCHPDEGPDGKNTLEYFIEQEGVGVYVNGTNILKYDEYETQIAYNPGRNLFRIQTNDQGIYVQLIFTRMPDPAENVPVEVSICYRTEAGSVNLETVMKTVKEQGRLYWLWDEERKAGVVIPENWEVFFE